MERTGRQCSARVKSHHGPPFTKTLDVTMTKADALEYAKLSHYDRLVLTGAMGSLKRDVLREATDDVWFLDHIRAFFERESGGSPTDVTPCTVRMTRELIGKDLVNLCTWGQDGAPLPLRKTEEELTVLVDSLMAHPFEFFLTTTPAGKDWVARYRHLVEELR